MNKSIKALALAVVAAVGITVAGTAPADAAEGWSWTGLNFDDQWYYPVNDSCGDFYIDTAIEPEAGRFPAGSYYDIELEVTNLDDDTSWGASDYTDGYLDEDGTAYDSFMEFLCIGTDGVGHFEVSADTTIYDDEYNVIDNELTTWTGTVGIQTKLSMNAGPEPVKRGKTIYINGYLKDAHGYDLGLTNRLVHLYKRVPGHTTWNKVATHTTSSTGHYGFTYKATSTLDFKVVYAPVQSKWLTAGSTSIVDRVPVVK